MKARTLLSMVAISGMATATSAGWQEIDLNVYGHGTVLNGVDLGPATGSADNFHSSTDLLVAFDTNLRDTRDKDLEGPNGSNGKWKKGNLKASKTNVGTILIIQEIDKKFDGYTDGTNSVVKKADDEGRRSGGSQAGAGEITLNFDNAITAFGFTLIDVEETGEFNKETGFFATFFSGGSSTKVSFADLVDKKSSFYDPTVKFGDNSANRIEPITAQQLGMASFDRVAINLGGSGGVGELRATGVPTPGAAGAGLAMMGLIMARRRRKA